MKGARLYLSPEFTKKYINVPDNIVCEFNAESVANEIIIYNFQAKGIYTVNGMKAGSFTIGCTI